jgi:uncharacterized protein YecE (DUF72 family)
MAVFVGTSGWQYRDWRPAFYPARLAQKDWLVHYADRFRTVEVNNTFYRLPPTQVFAGWRYRTPEDFVVAPKLSRYLSHVRRLADPEEPVRRFLERTEGLGPKLGPVLLQLPPTLRADRARLAEVLALWPPTVRLAFEPRHESWLTDETCALLADHGVALCLADRGGRPLGPLWRTADWGYVRLHEGTARPRPCYGRSALARWAERVAERWAPEADVYVFFNNDARCCAVEGARRFAFAARRAGLRPTRVPAPGDVQVVGR